jgi:hypothetical protein
MPSLAACAGAIAAARLSPHLERGRASTPASARRHGAAFGASDAEGAWDWKTAYDACEAATVLFLRKFGPALRARRSRPPPAADAGQDRGLLPTHTRRSEESQALQQFSTPIPLGFAAAPRPRSRPPISCWSPRPAPGFSPSFAELAGGALVLNELAETRAALLGRLFPGVAVTRFDAAQIDDHLDAGVAPSVVLMNPPFSAMAMSIAAWPTPRFAISPRRWRASPRAGGSSRSPARASRRTIRPGATPSSGCRSAAASCSPPPSTARSMPSTAPRSTRG